MNDRGNYYLPYGRQWIEDGDIEEVVKTLKGDYLTTGPLISEFESKFANYVGSRYAVAVSSGTAALHAAVFSLGIKSGDEIITSPLTFAASANAILYQGGIPVFADIDPLTYNIDPADIEKKITDKTKAIIPVHYSGQPCAMDEILRIAKKYNIKLIEDAAHALGASYKDRKIGSLSELTIFSFHPVKHITTGEGGMITTNSRKLYDRLIQFRNHGISRDRNRFTNIDEGPWYYEQQFLGYNYRITDFQAALGLSQLKKIDSFIARRREIASYYNEAFRDKEGLTIPYQAEESNSAWHIYVIKLVTEKLVTGRKEIFRNLKKAGLGVNVHYIPVYYHPFYQELEYKRGLCPVAERLYEKIITIPLFPKMSDRDINMVIKIVREVISKYLIKKEIK